MYGRPYSSSGPGTSYDDYHIGRRPTTITSPRLYSSVEPPDRASSAGRRRDRHSVHFSEDGREHAALLRAEVLDLEAQIRHRDQRLADVEKELTNYREIENQQTRSIRQLQDEVNQARQEAHDRAASLSHAESRAATLEVDNNTLADRLNDAEKRLARQLDDVNQFNHQTAQLERNYEQLRSAVLSLPVSASASSNLYTSRNNGSSHETALGRVRAVQQQLSGAEQQVASLQTHVQSVEMDNKRLQESLNQILADHERTRQQLDTTQQIRNDAEAVHGQLDQARQELKQLQQLLDDSRRHSEQQHKLHSDQQLRQSELEAACRQHELSQRTSEQEYRAFKESLASLLSDGYAQVQPNEPAIREKIRLITAQEKSTLNSSRLMEDKLKELAAQLEEQAELHQKAVERARSAETELDKMQSDLRAAKGQLQASDILKNGWSHDKNKYSALLMQLAAAMQMHKMITPAGTDISGDTLLARAQYLANVEAQLQYKVDKQMDKLKDEIKVANRELETKDAHLELLRKKLVTLDEQKMQSAERDFDDVLEKNKKLIKQVEKQSTQLQEARLAIQTLKHEYAQNKGLKSSNEDLRRQLHELQKRLQHEEQTRLKADKRLTDSKRDALHSQGSTQRTLQLAESQVHSLTAEVQRLKQAVSDMGKREKQLSDLRHVIARMLGLNADKLAVADYEIISRMERLIEGQHLNALGGSSQTRPVRTHSTRNNNSSGAKVQRNKTIAVADEFSF